MQKVQKSAKKCKKWKKVKKVQKLKKTKNKLKLTEVQKHANDSNFKGKKSSDCYDDECKKKWVHGEKIWHTNFQVGFFLEP